MTRTTLPASAVSLREMRERLQLQLSMLQVEDRELGTHLDKKIADEHAKAKAFVQQKNKKAAMLCLRNRRRFAWMKATCAGKEIVIRTFEALELEKKIMITEERAFEQKLRTDVQEVVHARSRSGTMEERGAHLDTKIADEHAKAVARRHSSASWSVQRALLTPQAIPGSCYHRSKST